MLVFILRIDLLYTFYNIFELIVKFYNIFELIVKFYNILQNIVKRKFSEKEEKSHKNNSSLLPFLEGNRDLFWIL